MAGISALAIGYVLSQFYRTFLAVLTPVLGADIGASNAQLATASGAWFLAFALSQLPVGVWLDRFGPRRTTSLLLAVGGAGALLFSAATRPWMVIAAMTLIGIGCAPVLMASVFIFARTYNPARLAILVSWMVGVGSAGNVIGAAPLAGIVDALGWRMTLGLLGLLTLATAGAVYAFVRDPAGDASQAGPGGFAGYLELFRIKALWAILPLVALGYAGSAGLRSLWGGAFLADIHGADALLIGRVMLSMALAMVAGSFIYGPLDTLFGTRKWIALTGHFLCLAAFILLALYPTASVATVTVLLSTVGLAGASYGIMMAHGSAFLPAHLMGRGVTMLNFFWVGGAGAMQLLSGLVFEAAARGGEPVAAYQTLFWFYAGSLGLALAVYLLFARDAKPR